MKKHQPAGVLYYRALTGNDQAVWQVGVLNGFLLTQLHPRVKLAKLRHATSYTPDLNDSERGTFCFNTLYLYRDFADFEADKSHPHSKYVRIGGAATTGGAGPGIACADRKNTYNGRFDGYETRDGRRLDTLNDVIACRHDCGQEQFEQGVLYFYHWHLQSEKSGGYQLRQSPGKIHPIAVIEVTPPAPSRGAGCIENGGDSRHERP
ncbi:hypothetical protein EDC14_10212 [Hydrogenispora ethanolica]|uniref:Uncharacterized protein n=1 Tax=Hydrogenispora ethanolica TaxID=1082276 RepID=A0A4R1RBU7_HYDET|nr:hypothetical protein [Hydrogenispora ethanolica]TCL63284.1 hypothetical protein EDC14_10212 [Hydrogenispora ethanolica]